MITKSELQSRLFAEENRAAKLVAENRQLRKELEMARSQAATAEKWQGLATARHGDGRTVQEIQREAAETEREACAKACEAQQRMAGDGTTFYTATGQCAAAIRARSFSTNDGSRDAPDCAGAQHERQDASDEGQGHNQEIRS